MALRRPMHVPDAGAANANPVRQLQHKRLVRQLQRKRQAQPDPQLPQRNRRPPNRATLMVRALHGGAGATGAKEAVEAVARRPRRLPLRKRCSPAAIDSRR